MDQQRTKRTPHNCFRCGSEDRLITKCPKPPKYNNKQKNQIRFIDNGNNASQKVCKNGDNFNNQNIYAYMAQMPGNNEIFRGDFGYIFQLKNWILDSVVTCHMTPQVLDFIPGSLEDTDGFIEVLVGHNFTAKQKGQVQI